MSHGEQTDARITSCTSEHLAFKSIENAFDGGLASIVEDLACPELLNVVEVPCGCRCHDFVASSDSD